MERSGKTEWVHFRRAWPKFLRQTFRAAVRSLAFKWIRPAFRCWQDRVPYDDARYVASLHRHGSPLAAGLALKKPGQIPLDRITQKTS